MTVHSHALLRLVPVTTGCVALLAATLRSSTALADEGDVVAARPPAEAPFRLVRTGLTFGAALSAQIGNVLYTKTARQDTVQAVAMPYVEVLPAYWFGPGRAKYCSLFGSVDDATLRASGGNGGSCVPYQLGLFLGRPANYDATTTILADQQAQQRRSIHPDLAVGVAFTPSAFFSVLGGWTFASTTRQDGTEAFLGAVTVGIGVNADVVAWLF